MPGGLHLSFASRASLRTTLLTTGLIAKEFHPVFGGAFRVTIWLDHPLSLAWNSFCLLPKSAARSEDRGQTSVLKAEKGPQSGRMLAGHLIFRYLGCLVWKVGMTVPFPLVDHRNEMKYDKRSA